MSEHSPAGPTPNALPSRDGSGIAARQLGSAADFDRAWIEALKHGQGQWFVYPNDKPLSQFELFDRIKMEEVQALLERYGLQEGLVLEYGCGSASISIYLVNRGFDAVGCDISYNALRVAAVNRSMRPEPPTAGRFETVAGNSLQLPFADGSFDIVMSYGLLEHFEPSVVADLLREVNRTLRPGGLFLADIVHGRFSSRQIGLYLSMLGSMAYRLLAGRWREMAAMPAAYLDALYENEMDDRDWLAAIGASGLEEVGLRICHPLPPLALPGLSQQWYLALLQRLEGRWRWFNRTQPAWARYWGWMYLVWGRKPQ